MQSSKIKHGYTEQHRKHFACVTPFLVRTSSALGGLSWEVVHHKRRRRTGEHQQTSSLWMFLCMPMEVPHSLHWHWSQLKEQLRTKTLLASTPRGWSCLYGDTWLLGPEGHLISGIRYHSTLLYRRLELWFLFSFLWPYVTSLYHHQGNLHYPKPSPLVPHHSLAASMRLLLLCTLGHSPELLLSGALPLLWILYTCF